MSDTGTIARCASIIASLMSGAVHDRKTLSVHFGMTVASADRYIRELQRVPGVMSLRQGRRHAIKFYFWAAARAAGI